MARAGDQEKESLLRDIADGTLDPHLDIPPDVRAALAPQLRASSRAGPRAGGHRRAAPARSIRKDYWPPHRS